jgi:hypothetical protein
MVYVYFYIGLYRFSGATNFKITSEQLALLNYYTIANIGLTTAVLHVTSIWHIHDIMNLTSNFSLNLNDYV